MGTTLVDVLDAYVNHTNDDDYIDATVSGYLDNFYNANGLDTEVTQSGIDAWKADNADDMAAIAAGTFADTPASYAHYEHQESQGTDGGTNTNGSWETRELNTTVSEVGGIERASNSVSLPAGTYRCTGRSATYGVNAHQCRLYDTTNSQALLWGTPAYSSATDPGGDYGYDTETTFDGIVVCSGTISIEIQHYMANQRTAYGWGRARNLGTEIYARLTIVRLA